MNNLASNSPLSSNEKNGLMESSSEEEEMNDSRPLLPASGLQNPTKKRSEPINTPFETGVQATANDTSSSHDENGRNKVLLLSFSLFTILLNFWLLDSLKDPIFAVLSSDLQRYQPIAKMVSVASTLILVCGMELISHERRRQERKKRRILGVLSKDDESGEGVSASLFWMVGIPYCIMFWGMGYCLSYHHHFSKSHVVTMAMDGDNDDLMMEESPNVLNGRGGDAWHILGFMIYITIESYGSISVATFWSFANSSLDLDSAKKHYGFIIAMAQIGAILGATIATMKRSVPWLFGVSGLVVCLNMLTMRVYAYWYPHVPVQKLQKETTSMKRRRLGLPLRRKKSITASTTTGGKGNADGYIPNGSDGRWKQRSSSHKNNTSNAFFSGVYLILRYNYLLLILGVSCLYEVALTCLDYEMKSVGLRKFELQAADSALMADGIVFSAEDGFATFIGHYGQLTNFLSLLLSFFGFPLMISKLGLRRTLRVFPSILLIATVLIFYTQTQPNLWLIFSCLALLKAMTYSINDPAKEILYIPTSNTIKFKAKFWIDVVGARVAKAVGSSITNYAGTIDRIVQYGSIPSVLTSLILLLVSVKAGQQFDHLVDTEEIVGLVEEKEKELQEEEEDVGYQLCDGENPDDYDDEDEEDSISNDHHHQFGGSWKTNDNFRGSVLTINDIGAFTDYHDADSDGSDHDHGWESNTTIEMFPSQKKRVSI